MKKTKREKKKPFLCLMVSLTYLIILLVILRCVFAQTASSSDSDHIKYWNYMKTWIMNHESWIMNDQWMMN